VRQSLDLTWWEAAQRLVRDMEIGGSTLSINVKEATEKFLDDVKARKLSKAITKKYQYVCAERTFRKTLAFTHSNV